MRRDPLTPSDPHSPYDVLSSVGVTPASTMAEIRHVSFALMKQGRMNATVRRSWDALRIAERRAYVDFFLYPVDLDDEFHLMASKLDDTGFLCGLIGGVPRVRGFETADLQEMAEDFRPIASSALSTRPPPEVAQWPEISLDDFTEIDH